MKRYIVLIIIFLCLTGLTAYYLLPTTSDLNNTLILQGNVDVRVVDLGFRVGGRVKSLHFEEGDVINSGDIVGRLDDRPYLDLVAQNNAILQTAIIEYENAELLFQRRHSLLEEGGVSFEDFETAKYAKNAKLSQVEQAKAELAYSLTNLADTQIISPRTGTLLTRIKEPGSIVNPGDAICTLTITDPVWIRAFVSEPNLALIYPGMKALIHLDSKELPTYEGHIGFISPISEFTPKTVETLELRTDLVYRLRVIVDNPDHYLKQGMPVSVELLWDKKSHE